MANLPIKTYKGTSSYLSTIANTNGNLLFDTDKKEIFLDNGTTRESYGGGAGDKTYATLAQAKADIANISEKDTVFVKEGTSGSLTQRVDKLEDEVEQINTDLSVLSTYDELYLNASVISTRTITVTDMSKYRYIAVAVAFDANSLNNLVMIPYNLFKVKKIESRSSGGSGNAYAGAQYISDTSISVYSSLGGIAVYGIK